MRPTTVLAGLLAVAGCTVGASADEPTRPSRPTGKAVCPELVLHLPAQWEIVDRRFVPYSPTLLGTEVDYALGPMRLQVVSGGYIDDVIETYDGLSPRAPQALRTTLSADVSTVRHLGTEVWVATWRETQLAVPCDARALLGTNVDESTFRLALDSLREEP